MKKILTPFLLFVVLTVSAQTVIVYDPYNTTKQVDKKDKASICNNIQWNFSLLSRGAFVLTYERKINEYIGLEGGLGLTYMDPMSTVSMLDYYSESSQEYKGGFLLSGALKIYPKEMEDFEGLYVSPLFRYRSYASTTTITESYLDASYIYVDKTTDFNQNLRAIDTALLFGYQYEGDSGILWNAYVGAGWTKKSYDEINFNQTTLEFEKKPIRESFPNILLGMSLGFTF